MLGWPGAPSVPLWRQRDEGSGAVVDLEDDCAELDGIGIGIGIGS